MQCVYTSFYIHLSLADSKVVSHVARSKILRHSAPQYSEWVDYNTHYCVY